MFPELFNGNFELFGVNLVYLVGAVAAVWFGIKAVGLAVKLLLFVAAIGCVYLYLTGGLQAWIPALFTS